ncbi:hypothetical protein PCE1_004431 [Barthelona sp. PCE]
MGFLDEYSISLEDEMKYDAVKRVYMHLCLTLTLTAVISYAMYGRIEVTTDASYFVVPYVLSIILLITLFCVKHSTMASLIVLYSFVFCFSFCIGFIVSSYEADAITAAVFLTGTIVLVLTGMVWSGKISYTITNQCMGMAMTLLIMSWVMLWLFPAVTGMSTLYCILGAFIFSLFLIGDTARLMHMHIDQLETEWAIVVVDLYLDIINLFLYILQILGKK